MPNNWPWSSGSPVSSGSPGHSNESSYIIPGMALLALLLVASLAWQACTSQTLWKMRDHFSRQLHSLRQFPIRIKGIDGKDGTNGSNGLPGPGIPPNYAEFFANMPTDNPLAIAPSFPIAYPQNGPTTGTIIRDPSVVTNDQFILPAIGTYSIHHEATLGTTGVPISPVSGFSLISNFAVITGTGLTNLLQTIIRGDVAQSPAATPLVGFPPGLITGNTYIGGNVTAIAAKTNLTTAYTYVASLPAGTPIGANLGGQLLAPGTYSGANLAMTSGPLVLSGKGNYFFHTVGNLTTAATSDQVMLINGAVPTDVYWAVAGTVTFVAGTMWQGTVMSLGTITPGLGSTFQGGLFSSNGTVVLDGNISVTAPNNLFAPSQTTPSGAPPGGGQLAISLAPGLFPAPFVEQTGPTNNTVVGIVNSGRLQTDQLIITTAVNTRIKIVNPTVGTLSLLLQPIAGSDALSLTPLPVTARIRITQVS